jgi:hypothetical protein
MSGSVAIILSGPGFVLLVQLPRDRPLVRALVEKGYTGYAFYVSDTSRRLSDTDTIDCLDSRAPSIDAVAVLIK